MDFLPILLSLRHNKVGALLIGLQIALTLAIVANSAFIIQTYVQQLHTPSGIDEANIFTLSNEWVTLPDDLEARIKEDLTVLRSLPGVVDAEATGGFPLCECSGLYFLELRSGKDDKYHQPNIRTYLVDDHGLSTYGLSLVAGRWFTATEVGRERAVNPDVPVATVITQHLANELFPAGDALGQVVHFDARQPTRIVGILRFATSTYIDGYHQSDAAFVPLLYLRNPINYVVRTIPGQQAQVMRAAQEKLYALTRERVIQNVQSFSETRRHAALDKRTSNVMLGVVSSVLVIVTAFGIVGLTQFWVTQRRRQIGMRRALGARRVDILKYFLAENLLIAGGGCVLGIALGLGGNTWLLTRLFGLEPMSPAYMCGGALLVLVLSQLAVLWPALRAAAVPPAIATRGL
jgi:putative ABC transport system permease protein